MRRIKDAITRFVVIRKLSAIFGREGVLRMLKFMEGHRTNIIAGLVFFTGVAHAAGWIDMEMMIKIDAVLGAFGLHFLRQGIKNKK